MAKDPTDVSQEKSELGTTYLLDANSSRQIFLSLKIGDDGQLGVSTISIGADEQRIDGSCDDIPIGMSDDINLTDLFIDTVIQDVSPSHNHATLRITLKGGVSDITYPLGKLVNEGEEAMFTAKILMLKL